MKKCAAFAIAARFEPFSEGDFQSLKRRESSLKLAFFNASRKNDFQMQLP